MKLKFELGKELTKDQSKLDLDVFWNLLPLLELRCHIGSIEVNKLFGALVLLFFLSWIRDWFVWLEDHVAFSLPTHVDRLGTVFEQMDCLALAT